MISKRESPYLANPDRLSDVIAAIQVMGTYKFYKLDYKGWSKRITGVEKNADYWGKVINEHAEFFRLNNDKTKASLVWRRSHQRRYHVDKAKVLSKEEYDALEENEKSKRVSRVPLSSSDIATLMSTAIDIHARALEKKKDSRWLITMLVGFLGVVLGAAIKAWV